MTSYQMLPSYSPSFRTCGFLCLLFSVILFFGCKPQGPNADLPSNTGPGGVSIADADLNDLMLPTTTGDSLSMADFEGQVILLNFWATWCGPCRYEIPDLIELQDEFGTEGFTVIGISLDEDDPVNVTQFAEAMEVNYPIALDQMGVFAEAFGGVYALPTTYILDREGQVAHRTIGLFPTETMKETLQELIDAD